MSARTVAPRAKFAAALAVLVAATGSLALGASSTSVNLPVRGKDTIKGTLRPAFDEEQFLCDVPQGATFAVSLKGKSPTGPVFQPDLVDGGGGDVGATFVTKGKTLALAPGFAAPASGRYRVRVRGDFEGDGDYELKIAWKTRTLWTAAGGPLAAAGTASFTFGAVAGSVATIDVRPAPRAAFAGEILSVTGPDGPLVVPGGTTSHLVIARLPSTGDYTVEFRNAGAVDGSWTAKAKLRPPRVAPSRIDIRDARLTGAFGGDHTVYGSVLGPTGGTLEVTASFGPLDGSSVSIPSGVLSGPTILTVSAAPPLATGGGNHPAGPAVEFGPPGTTFDPSGSDPSKQATITIPFDPAYFPSGTGSLVIFVRSSSGVVTEVPGPYVFNGNTVSFTTSHFSAYQAATADPRGLSGQFLILELGGDQKPAFGGQFGFGVHSLYADAAGATIDVDGAGVRWSSDVQTGPSATLSLDYQSLQIGVQVVDDATVVLDDPQDQEPPLTLRRGVSDDVLVGADEQLVLLRRAGAQATLATAAGRWHVFHYGIATRIPQTQPPGLTLELSGDTGAVTLAADGTTSFAPRRGAESHSDFPTGMWQPKIGTETPTGITWDASEGAVWLRNAAEQFNVRLVPVLDGDVLIGRAASYGGQSPDEGPYCELFVLVRASAAAKLPTLAGTYAIIGADAETVDRPASTQGMDFTFSALVATIAKSGEVAVDGSASVASHDSQGNPTEVLRPPVHDTGERISLKPDGSFTSTAGAVGVFSRKGEFFVRSVFDGTTFSLVFGTPLVVQSP